jgi:hypothetical protein
VNQLRAKNFSSGNIVAIIQEKRPEVKVSFSPNELGQNEKMLNIQKFLKI